MQTDTIEKKRIPLIGDRPPLTPETDMRSGIPTIPGATPGRIPLVVRPQPAVITRRAGDEPPLASERTPMSRPIAAAAAPAPTGIPIIPGTPPTGVMPTIADTATPNLPKPTPQESQAAGKSEYQSGMPSITAAPLTKEYFQQNEEKNQYEKVHPWGSDISAHPGTLGKIGHVLGRIGNIAGDVLAPGPTSLIPGSDLNRQRQTAENEAGFEKAQTEQTAEQEAQARTTEAATGEKRLPIEQETADAEKYKAENRTPTTDFQQWRLQNPNAPVDDWLKLKPEPTASSIMRHRKNCSVCANEKRDEIDRDFVAWHSPIAIATEYGLSDRRVVYRHAHALGLFPKRDRNIRAALAHIIEKSGDVDVTAAAVVAAIQAYAKINAQGLCVDRSEHVNMNEIFERMSRDELEKYASEGELPGWFTEASSVTDCNTEEDENVE